MANELHNAAALMKDVELRELIIAASVHVARTVFTEGESVPNHAVRLNMAKDIVSRPDAMADRLRTIISCDSTVATLGNTAAVIPEAMIISKVEGLWTMLAETFYPVPV